MAPEGQHAALMVAVAGEQRHPRPRGHSHSVVASGMPSSIASPRKRENDSRSRTDRCLRRKSERTTPRAGYALVSSMCSVRSRARGVVGSVPTEAADGKKGSSDDGKSIENRTQPELVPNQASKSTIVRGALKID